MVCGRLGLRKKRFFVNEKVVTSEKEFDILARL